MRKRKILSAILIVCMLTLCLAVFAGCDEETPTTETYKDKAIIICTALTSGGLYDSETGLAVWDPLNEDVYYQQFMGGDMIGAIFSLLLDTNTYSTIGGVLKYGTDEEKANNFIWQIALDENGKSNNPNLVPANGYGDGKIEYGALAAYREQCLDLREVYGEEYDVTVFNYDWRIDNRINSQLLEDFIEQRGYSEVILTSHSMGGPVVAGYLARSQNNRDKVSAYHAYSPAYAGSVDALYFLDDPIGAAYDVVGGMGIDISGLGLEDALNALLVPLIQNMTSVMQLLPFPVFIDSEWYKEGESCIKVGDDYVPAEGLYDFYCSRDWAKKSDGSLKPAMVDLEEYWDSFFVDTTEDGVKDTFAPQLVNTYYHLGTGICTKKTLVFESLDTTYDHKNIIYGDGDGTMPINASLCGLSINDVADGHLILYERGGHGNVGADWPLMKAEFYRLFEELRASQNP